MKLFRQMGEKPAKFKKNKKQKIIILGAGLTLGGFFCCQNCFFSTVLAREGDENNKIAVQQNQNEKNLNSGLKVKEDGKKIGLCDNLQSVNSEAGLTMKELCELSNFQKESLVEIEKRESKQRKQNEQEKFEKSIRQIVKGTPMEKMAPFISQQEKIVAAFLVGIALKESSFGVHAPHKNGQDCYNYWGYKGVNNSTGGSYSCFSSPEQAVEVVGKRLKKLAIDQQRNTPEKMIVWKCGNSCVGHDPAGVAKWIQDVSANFNKINNS